MASRRGWDHEKHLDIMLPKLQGLAGDYTFDELSSEECSRYKVVMKHLKHQFHKVESAKSYPTMFWRWDQKDLDNIDEALDEVVKYRETCQSGNLTKEGTR